MWLRAILNFRKRRLLLTNMTEKNVGKTNCGTEEACFSCHVLASAINEVEEVEEGDSTVVSQF